MCKSVHNELDNETESHVKPTRDINNYPLKMSILSPTVEVSFTLNGHDVQLSGVDPNTTLNEWIRSQHGLSGTKRMCGEGGCGCCVVSVLRKDPTTGSDATISINSVSMQVASIV